MVIIDQTQVINELTRGMELALKLRTQLGLEFSTQTNQILIEQMISSYEKALIILGCGSPQPHQLTPVASHLSPSSPSTYIGTPKGIDQKAKHSHNECSRKRKSASSWTQQVKTSSESGIRDGYTWRKYGQKDILGAKFPRSYYRCTYRSAQDCWATRYVQRSEDDPTVYEITYKGKHTCNVADSSRKQKPMQEHQQDYDMIGPVLCGDYYTSESNYFTLSSSDMDTFLQQKQYFDGSIADVVLGATSSIFR